MRSTYATKRNNGLDLISALIEKIENQDIAKKSTSITDGIDTTFVNFDNNIYIFTDGYLEYLNKVDNGQFYFGNAEINQVRQYCKTHKTDIQKALSENKNLSLPPDKNAKNKLINLHILETQERDKDDNLQVYKYPTGQRDNEILEAVWRKWARESGFKSFEWKKY